ncbi:TPA: SpaA isopeptide-forming pilin-related protein [Listeria monocytogenes]|uniref:SpaA isopeptide-forming pilin-related protein n=1 Tax=Listeria monocytogenes TaxID=1639 RepID=UPI00083E034B|nr:SpaA isopeptide-forming pilin-related protein [Listeria monocytogenes]EAC4228895.1 LPXTG cell wall anchor domain-containing protein [Listeria monocytogenes]EAE8310867.1 LPXTG cell wall anchor domain-containing protein [Listeria monocytogenes]EAF8283277.1 LPXTG cell wall anchor domain-containing protein [Listeria monocytogenes]EAG5856541.1 LPXTG cell wall anchor domain-containing protein [Listeria monocytogenes]ECL0122833.1 LPXTG cell wall anchor domain-containing protein [Listeria monocytog
MKNIRHWKKLVIAMVIGLLVFQNVSPVLATMTDDETAKTTLKITKEDKDTKEKINGSTFEIKNKETGETNDLTISANGEATMDSLSPGDYLVKEKVAPKGYTLDEKEYSVTLAEKEEVITSVSAKVQEETTKEATTPTPVKKATQNANLKAAITDNIFNKVTLKDGNGDEINTSDRIQNGSGVVLNMNFAFSGKNYKAGDTFTTVLPDAFNFGNKNLSGNFLPSTEAEWTLDVTTRELTITFLKDGIQEGDYDVNISTAFKVFTSTEETIQEVVFKTAGKDTVYQIEVVPVVNYPTTVGITANPGVVNPTKGQVDAKFNLTKEKDAKGELKLNDYASGGTTTIDKDTIKVYSSDVSAGGTFIGTKKLLVEGTDYTLTYSATSLTVTLNGGLAGKGYQVTYDRTINKPSDSLSYMSTQAYTVGDSGTLSSNSAYVYLTMTNYKHIEKKATYNGSTQSIDWKINFNFDQDEISPSTVLTDVLADNDVEYVADSLKIKRVTFNATNGSPIVGGDASSDWTTSAISANGNFNLTYKNTNTNAYEITYSTKITDFSDRKIKNEITDENGVSADATIAIQPDLLKKEAGTIDYFNNTMTWKITANSDRIKMGNLNITDEFSTGVKALKSYTVRAYTDNINSVLLTEGKDYTIDKDVTPAGFYIQLIGDYATTDKKIVVDFVTEIDLSDVTKTIDNKASISYYDGGIIKYVDDVKASMTPDPAMMTNGGKYGSYNSTTGNIDWIVSVNAMAKNYDNLIFDDAIPTGLTYVEGSLQYRNVASTSEMMNLYIPLNSVGTVAKTGDKNYPTKVDTTGNKLHLEFANLENSRVFIKYSTKPNENWYFYSYVQNTAKVSDNGVGEKSYSYQAYASKLYNAMTKTATIDPSFDNKVNWVVTLNNISADRPINNPTITDTMKTGTTGAQVVKSSFKVINETTGEDIDSKYYDITYTDNNFTIQFKDYKATAPIKVTYSTISLMSGLVSNTATTASPDYGSLPMTYKSRTTSISPAFTIGSGSGTATIGSLEITKVDKKDNTKKLAGAKFQLYTLEGDKAGQEATTDTDGKIVMDGLQSGKYKLVETEAPTGYTISDEYKDGKEITVTADAVTNVTIENTEQTGSAVLLKEDSVTKDAIAGAEFELQNADGTKVAENLVSNADGKIEVTDLAPGDYQFVETKAPTGYVLDATPSEFTIEFNQEAAVIVTKENTAKTGSVVLTKEDSVTKATIAGAEFDLQKADGTKVSENLITDADGKIEANDLAPGDYQFVETKAAAGYVLDATPSEFTIEFNQDKAAVVTKENTAKSGSVVLTKQDSATKAALSDAEFELQTATGTKVKDNLTTNASGEIEVADLAPGDYKFIETKAPTGYELDATPVTFTIEFNQSTAVKVTKENVAKTGSVVLTKLDSKSRSNLAGAEFELQTKLGVSLKDKVVTEANGQLQIDNLAPGDYQLVETKAPTGYELDATPVEFTIEFNQKDAVQVTKTNKMSTGSVVLTKTDGQTKAPLADATFKLVDADNNVTENLTTDASGKLEITNLSPGDYQLIETKAPKGYELDTVPVDVKISFNQNQVLQVTKTNIKTVVSGKVIAEFVDTKGNVLAEQEIHAGLVGEKYVTKAKSIAGYKLTKDPTNKVGIYKEADQKVTFVYEKNKSPLVVDPTKPIKPSKPTKPSANPSKQATVKKAQSLPSTGDNSLANLIITGLFASTLGLFLLRKSKKVND